jgi:lysophospholipase L1-like esterase
LHRSKQFSKAFKILARLALSAMLTILCAEGIVRVSAFLWSDYGAYYFFYGFLKMSGNLGISPWSTHQGGYYKFPPRYQLKGAAGQAAEAASINSLGFRGPEFQPIKRAGTFRIVCMGESSTFGYRNSDGGTYPVLLEKIFRQASSEADVEVINAGFPYYNSASILALLREEISAYNPDVITLYSAFNDAAWPLKIDFPARIAFWIQEHSAVYLVVKENLRSDRLYLGLMSKIARRLRPQAVDYEPFRIEIDQVALRFRNNVKAIIKFANEKGIAIVLIKQPMTAQDRRSDNPVSYEAEYQAVMEKFRARAFLSANQLLLIKHHRLIEELEKIAAEEGLQVVDNIAIVDQNNGGLASWVHLTESANLRLAQALKSAIEPLVKTRLLHSSPQTDIADH